MTQPDMSSVWAVSYLGAQSPGVGLAEAVPERVW
jgi:hypothetical protein